jgi:hypothetical protein
MGARGCHIASTDQGLDYHRVSRWFTEIRAFLRDWVANSVAVMRFQLPTLELRT